MHTVIMPLHGVSWNYIFFQSSDGIQWITYTIGLNIVVDILHSAAYDVTSGVMVMVAVRTM